MKAIIVSIALLLLCTSASFASPPAAPALFSSLGSGDSCSAPMLAAAGEDRGGITTQSTCTANCAGGCTVSWTDSTFSATGSIPTAPAPAGAKRVPSSGTTADAAWAGFRRPTCTSAGVGFGLRSIRCAAGPATKDHPSVGAPLVGALPEGGNKGRPYPGMYRPVCTWFIAKAVTSVVIAMAAGTSRSSG